MMSFLTPITVFLISLGLTVIAYGGLRDSVHPARTTQGQLDEVMYLPSGEGLNFISFGYKNVLSQYLWFKTISYFGKHYRIDQNYRWLAHMCDLVIQLNPKAEHTYTFCSAMLAWEAHNVPKSNEILTRAMEADPKNWYLPYLRGFNYTYFLKDQEKARDDFIAASKLPNAHPIAAKLAAKKLSELGGPETAIEFLEETIQRASDSSEREALTNKLNTIRAQHEKKKNREELER